MKITYSDDLKQIYLVIKVQKPNVNLSVIGIMPNYDPRCFSVWWDSTGFFICFPERSSFDLLLILPNRFSVIMKKKCKLEGKGR